MTKGVRFPNDGWLGLPNERQHSRGTIESRQKAQKVNSRTSRKPLQSLQTAGRNTSSYSLKYKGSPPSEEQLGVLVQRDCRAEKHHTDRQNLADIILMQARRIEKQQREMHRIKAHYERQVSTIKNNAIMLESHLQKVLASVERDRAKRIGHHCQDMLGAVEKLQKSDIQVKQSKQSQPQSVASRLLIQYLQSKAMSHSTRNSNGNTSNYRNML
ncbi:uncharacterized protein LOC6534323 [Drosophila yakuba]|uniref:Uncharacterized protein n=1 Tax=Drosophila yakuba TaxID=7245 RepID=B4PJU6_DROYA|nr:uncharacterized protein LOC6534323 [Drosophila yakuba]EDW94715.1 uncharacterized protein Dyak_GE22145 [Drosophila yakuba]